MAKRAVTESSPEVFSAETAGSSNVGVGSAIAYDVQDNSAQFLAQGLTKGIQIASKGVNEYIPKMKEEQGVALAGEVLNPLSVAARLAGQKAATNSFGKPTYHIDQATGQSIETNAEAANTLSIAEMLPGASQDTINQASEYFYRMRDVYQKSGKFTQSDMGVMIQSKLKELINRNPALESDIIKAATAQLGFDPTPSTIRQALGEMVQKPAPTVNEFDKHKTTLEQAGLSPEEAHTQTSIYFRTRDEIQSNQLKVQRGEETGRHLSALASSQSQAITQQAVGIFKTLQANGTMTENYMKDNRQEHSLYMTDLYNQAIGELRSLTPPNVDNSRQIETLRADRDDVIKMIENGSYVKYLTNQSELNKALLDADLEENTMWTWINKVDPSYANEFVNAMTKSEDNQAFEALWIQNDKKADPTRQRWYAYKAGREAREARITGKPIGESVEDRGAAILDSSIEGAASTPDLKAGDIDPRDVSRADTIVRLAQQSSIPDAISSWNRDSVQKIVNNGMNPESLARITSLGVNEFNNLLAIKAELMADGALFEVNPSGQIEVIPATRSTVGAATGGMFGTTNPQIFARSFAVRANSLMDSARRYGFDNSVNAQTLLPTTEDMIAEENIANFEEPVAPVEEAPAAVEQAVNPDVANIESAIEKQRSIFSQATDKAVKTKALDTIKALRQNLLDAQLVGSDVFEDDKGEYILEDGRKLYIK